MYTILHSFLTLFLSNKEFSIIPLVQLSKTREAILSSLIFSINCVLLIAKLYTFYNYNAPVLIYCLFFSKRIWFANAFVVALSKNVPYSPSFYVKLEY